MVHINAEHAHTLAQDAADFLYFYGNDWFHAVEVKCLSDSMKATASGYRDLYTYVAFLCRRETKKIATSFETILIFQKNSYLCNAERPVFVPTERQAVTDKF